MCAAAPLAGIDAIILAGGLGTRLRTALPGKQKVTAEVSGHPFVFRLIDRLAAAGVRRAVLAVGYKAASVRRSFERLRRPELKVDFSEEEQPLGTGGGARLACERTTSDPVLVMNGDSFAEIDLELLLTLHRERRAAATLAIVRLAEPGRYGLVEADSEGEVLGFIEKPESKPHEGWISAGIYLLSRSALALLSVGQPASLERDLFPRLVGHGLFAARFDARFIDIGVPESLGQAEAFFHGEVP